MTEAKSKSIGKRILRGGFFVVIVLFLGGAGAVVSDRIIFPLLSSKFAFSRSKLLNKLVDNVTVITKTEQVTVQEDDSVEKIASRSAISSVNILSVSNKKDSTSVNNVNPVDFKNSTGVILTSDGFVATYRTAILEKDATYQVFIHDGNVVSAELVGVDEFTNLAFLRIQSQNLPVISFAADGNANPGRKLIYIGNFGGSFQEEFAFGILGDHDKMFNLSGKTVSSSEKLEGVYRVFGTEANRFVGGPAVNYQGEMVGIVGESIMNNEKNDFIIPAKIIREAMDRLDQDNQFQRPMLGLYYLPVTRSLSIAKNLSQDHGALVFSPSEKQGLAILAKSPAEKSGILVNDLIVSVNDESVDADHSLSNLIAKYHPGDQISLKIIRAGKELNLPVQL